MSDILQDLQQIRPLNSASVSSIVDVANVNFKKISQSLYSFLTAINYNQSTNSMTLTNLNAAVINVSKRISMLVGSNEMFSVDVSGRVWSKSYVAQDIIESKRIRLNLFTGAPFTTIGGEIIYGQIYTDVAQTVLSPIDFWGYVQGIGWHSLTSGTGVSGYLPTTSAIWAGEVQAIVNTPPVTIVAPARYLVDWSTPGNNEFATHEGQIAQYNFSTLTWEFTTVSYGTGLTDLNQYDKLYIKQYGGISWAAGAGNSGYSGYSGTSGYSGSAGVSGYSGETGSNGESGYSGMSGLNGYSGVSGVDGISGYSGKSGVSGDRGYSGMSGYSGITGTNGTIGTSGYSGEAGVSGYSGTSGKSGAIGFSGWSGYSGYSGNIGQSGYSGYSGYSGNPYTMTLSTTVTTDVTPSILATIPAAQIEDDSIIIISSYVTAFCIEDTGVYGGWVKTLTISKIAGTASIVLEQADSTKENGLENSLEWSIDVDGNVVLTVTGILNTIRWKSKYQIILP